MEKGLIKIKKNGSAELKKADGKKIPVPKLFDLTGFIPESGSQPFECEYLLDEYHKPEKIVIEGQALGFKATLMVEKKAKEERAAKREELEALKKAEELKYAKRIRELSSDSVKIADNPDKFHLPHNTRQVLSGNEYHIENFALKLNKCSRFEGDKFSFFKTNRGKTEYKIEAKPIFEDGLIQSIHQQHLQSANELCGQTLMAMNFKPDWRMVVGLGTESVYETSITLHHLYGIPYIPASSIKGVVRSWIVTEVFGKENLHFAEGNAIQNKEFCDVFGCPKTIHLKSPDRTFKSFYTQSEGEKKGSRMGNVIFFDAFPMVIPTIEPDIMNVHYPDYYGGDKPPGDTQNPRPIFFLTVKDTPFQFIIGTRAGEISDYKIAGRTITEWLKEALEEHGIGAKTAVGYGQLSEVY